MQSTADLFQRDERASAIDQLHFATAIYTCEPVVDALLDRVSWPCGTRALVDTSCGDGAFLRRALARLLQRHPELDDAELLGRIQGWEIHPFAADQARCAVAAVLGEFGHAPDRARQIARDLVRCGDFLTEGPRAPTFDVVIGNPPYLRMLNVPELLRDEYTRLVPEYARADLLHSFMDRSAKVLRPGGELALVTSDRWLANQGAARLREEVGRFFRLAHVERLDVNSTFYRPKQRRAGSPPRVHPCAVVLKPAEGVPITSAPIYPGIGAPAEAPTGLTLGDVCTIRLAPWLGTAGIFLVDAAVAEGLPREHLVPAIDTDDVRDGQLREPTRFALATSPDARPPQAVLDHLERTMPRMCARGRRASCTWLPPEPFHGFDLSVPSLLVPRIAKSLRPIRIPAGVLPVNHNLSIVRSGEYSLEHIEECLAGPVAADWFQLVAARLENGYRSITTRLLRQLPIG